MNILFLCTGNSARSILGEVICNDLFGDNCCAYSAGSNPVGAVNPAALAVLQKHNHKVDRLYSKSIAEFTNDNSPEIDLLISVCDNASNDCPVWQGSGNPSRLHWSLSDPAAIEAEQEKAAAFEKAYQVLKSKISAYLN